MTAFAAFNVAVYKIGNWNLELIWDLEIVIWDFGRYALYPMRSAA